MKVIMRNEGPLKQVLEAVGAIFEAICPDVWMVDIECLEDRVVLGEVMRHGGPVMLLDVFGQCSMRPLAGRSMLQVLGRERVGYSSLMPPELAEMISDLQLLAEGKPAPLRFDLAKLRSSWLSVIRHNLYPDKSEQSKQAAIADAQVLFGVTATTREDVLAALEACDAAPVECSGPVAEGVFCDVEGTLLHAGRIDQVVAERLRSLELGGNAITLWTGGDRPALAATLAENGIGWPLVSKHDYRGRVVQMAIDDLSEGQLHLQYGIKAEQFVRIER